MTNHVSAPTHQTLQPTQHFMGQSGVIIFESGAMGPLGLGIARSLGRRDIPVCIMTGEQSQSLAAVSRYIQHRLPWIVADETQQVGYLLNLAMQQQLSGWMLFPADDEAAALIARHAATLMEYFRLITSPWDVVQVAYDKRLTYRLAAEIGVDYPWTNYPDNRENLANLACTFPVILKPAIKKDTNRFTSAKAWRVENRQELLMCYDEACTLVDPHVIMVQELIPGGGENQFSYAALCFEGHPLASLVARRTRQYPIDFGRHSTYVETIDRPEVEELAVRLLSALHYTGLVEIEFKRDPRNGNYKLLDINARTWAWHTLGKRAGVDFPYLFWRLVQGEPVEEVRGRPGVRWLRMSSDLLAVAQELRQGHLSLRAYLQSLRPPLESAVFALDDPLPTLVELPLLIHKAWRQRCTPLRYASRVPTR